MTASAVRERSPANSISVRLVTYPERRARIYKRNFRNIQAQEKQPIRASTNLVIYHIFLSSAVDMSESRHPPSSRVYVGMERGSVSLDTK